jgi:GNAT superfamily N-acetyltransferase
MTVDHATDARSVLDAAPRTASRPDWLILRDTILQSVATSPDAFLATADKLAVEPPEYWKDRLKSSTWAVVQRGDDIVGVAAASPPSAVDDYASWDRARFIESVWIHPGLRGKGVGGRLVTYLIEQQRKAGIQEFYLWVFDHNTPAISLYKSMDFRQTPLPSQLPDITEIQFRRSFDSNVVDYEELKRNGKARRQDETDLRITYRLLTPAKTHVPWRDWLTGWRAGSISRYLKAVKMPSRLGKLAR